MYYIIKQVKRGFLPCKAKSQPVIILQKATKKTKKGTRKNVNNKQRKRASLLGGARIS